MLNSFVQFVIRLAIFTRNSKILYSYGHLVSISGQCDARIIDVGADGIIEIFG